MKKMLRRNLNMVVIIGMLCSLALSYLLQITMIRNDMDDSSRVLFWQINQILDQNVVESEEVRNEYYDMCLRKAKAAAYIIQNRDSDVNDHNEMRKIAELLEIDELHIFDTEGTICAGSEPKYFGYNFNSGEQMQFFLPMLSDRSMELCQNATPNTAEGKIMQYAAVWREDGQGIIQIGMEPNRLLRALEKNKLSYIFSLLVEGDGTELYAADPETGEILGATDTVFVGATLQDIGFTSLEDITQEKSFHTNIKGIRSYCIFSEMDDILIARVCDVKRLYGKINDNALILILCLLAIFAFMNISIFRYLDKHVIRGIDKVNGKLQSITDGNLDETVDVDNTPEFEMLSSHINQMVKSLLNTSDKLSSVLNMVHIPIGVYEYSQGAERVRITEKVAEILDLTKEEERKLIGSYVWLEERLAQIRENPAGSSDSNVFRLRKGEERYVKLESYERDGSCFGVLMDVTKDMTEKQRIKQERDEDMLTGLHNRRGYFARLDDLFENTGQLKNAAFVMIDTDNLKGVNDTFGHEAGDYYLRGMADVLRMSTAPKKHTARLSGDEFSIFLYGCESREELERYIAALEKWESGYDITCEDGLQLTVKFSMGTAIYQEDGQDRLTLMKCADERMYENKRMKKKMQM